MVPAAGAVARAHGQYAGETAALPPRAEAEVPDEAAAAANAKETTAFMSSMESFSREAMGASGAAMAATVGSVDERLLVCFVRKTFVVIS